MLEEELWRLFECEGSGELSLAAYDKYVQKQNTWLEGFRAMVADGIIDRRRVLTATLDALARDFAPFRAGWFSRLHEALKPTRAERVAYRERYLHLLSSRVPATVSFAMKALVEVDKAGALDAVGALNQLGAALDARDKGTAERALRILTKAAHNAGSASVKARIAAIAAQALGHQSVDVQALALSLIEANAAVENFDLSALAPSVRGGLKAKVVEHEAAMSSLPPGREVQGVVPVGNLGELAELFAAVLEHQGPPVDIERVVEGVARMSASERLTASLARRAGKMLDSRERQQLAAPSPSWHSHGLAGDRSRSLPPTTTSRTFLSGACGVLPSKTVQRQERPLMSLPTWPDGRIDPVEFARRAAAQPRHELDATHADPASLFNLDLLQARLRAGIDRERALPQLHLTWKTKTSQASGTATRIITQFSNCGVRQNRAGSIQHCSPQ